VRTLQDLQKNPVIRGETVNDYIITEEQLSFEYDLYTQPVYKEFLLDILLNG
jgi:hypothetical protein